MTRVANLTFRWSLAYLLIINSIDTISSHTVVANSSSSNFWLYYLVWLAALVNLAGGILLASGWKLPQTSLVLAISTSTFALIFQEPIATLLTIGLLILSINSQQSFKGFKIFSAASGGKVAVADKTNVNMNSNRECSC